MPVEQLQKTTLSKENQNYCADFQKQSIYQFLFPKTLKWTLDVEHSTCLWGDIKKEAKHFWLRVGGVNQQVQIQIGTDLVFKNVTSKTYLLIVYQQTLDMLIM